MFFLYLINLFLCQNIENLFKEVDKANLLLKEGDINASKIAFINLFNKYKTNKFILNEYLKFLKLTGNFEEILKNKDLFGLNKENIDLFNKYKNIFETKNYKKIFELIEICPNNILVVISTARFYLENKNKEKLKFYLNLLELFKENSIEYLELKYRYYFLINDIKNGLQILKEVDIKKYNEVNKFLNSINELEKINNLNYKINLLKNLYSKAQSLNILDKIRPSIYESILLKILNSIVENSISYKIKNMSFFSNKLYLLEKTQKNLIKHIQCIILDEKFQDAINILESNDINKKVKDIFIKEIEVKKKVIEKKEEQKRKEKKRKEEENRERQRQRRANENRYRNNNKGDFKGYYKTLGVKQGVNEKDLKKAHKKKAREADRKIKLDAKKGIKSEDVLLKVNKAYQVLSDKNKREMYDNGIDPEDPQQSSYNNHHFNYDPNDFNDIINSFFGNSRSRGGYSYSFYF